MPFNTFDDVTNALSNGRSFRADWNKNFLPTTAAIANEWHLMARGAGNPSADTLYNTGANLTFQPVSFSTTGCGGIPHGPDVGVGGFTKHLFNGSAFTSAITVAPCTLMLIDLIGFYRVTTSTVITSQALTNTLGNANVFTADASTDLLTHTFYGLLTGTRVQLTTTTTLPAGLSLATDYFVVRISDSTCKLSTSYANATASTPVTIDITNTGTGAHSITTLLPRYTNGAGVQAILWANNAVPLGAGVPNLSFPAYRNSTQVSSRATPTVLPIGKTACPNGQILYSGSGAGKYGPAMPLQAGDSGISQIDNVQLSATYTSGEFSIGLYKVLATFPISTLGVATEKEFINATPSVPRIYDGANLHFLINSGAATPVNSAIFGHLESAWN